MALHMARHCTSVMKQPGGSESWNLFGSSHFTSRELETIWEAPWRQYCALSWMLCYGAACFALTKPQYDQLELLHLESLTAIPSLHCVVIAERPEGHYRRCATTSAGKFVYKLGRVTTTHPPPQATAMAPWADVLVHAPELCHSYRSKSAMKIEYNLVNLKQLVFGNSLSSTLFQPWKMVFSTKKMQEIWKNFQISRYSDEQ